MYVFSYNIVTGTWCVGPECSFGNSILQVLGRPWVRIPVWS